MLRDPLELFPFLFQKGIDIYQCEILGLAPPLTANLPFGWTLSWLTMGGALSLISWVLPSLRRWISCCKSLIISIIRAMGSSFCTPRLCSETTSCSTKGISFLYLEATSFSPTGSDAAGGTLVPLLFLGL